MKTLRLSMMIVLLVGTAWATAADLDISIESGGKSAVVVPPGFAVRYRIIGELTDSFNEGLAMVSVDLTFDGGDLEPADEPQTPPMTHFMPHRGLSNPAGFGGTVIGGDLMQIGGLQNTMNNLTAYPSFPIGPVINGVAEPGSPVVLAEGFLTAPLEPGEYTLSVQDLHANVIREGEDGAGFWMTESAAVGAVADLAIVVDVDAVAVAGSVPQTGAIDARQPWYYSGGGPEEWDYFGWSEVELVVVGEASSLTVDDFEVAHTGVTDPPEVVGVTVAPSGDSVIVELSGRIEPLEWTTITHSLSGTNVRLGYLPGDVDGSWQSNVNDVLALIDHINGETQRPIYQTDIDRNDVTDSNDVLRLLELLNGDDPFPVFLGAELPE